jgi:hypothetical protein
MGGVMRKQKVKLKKRNSVFIQDLRRKRYKFLRNQITLCKMAMNSRVGEAGVVMSQGYESYIEWWRMLIGLLNKEFPHWINRYMYRPTAKQCRYINKWTSGNEKAKE